MAVITVAKTIVVCLGQHCISQQVEQRSIGQGQVTITVTVTLASPLFGLLSVWNEKSSTQQLATSLTCSIDERF